MLKKEYLEVKKRKPNIAPRYRPIDENVSTAERVIDVYEEGKSREEIEREVSELEDHDNFKFVRALSSLLERWAEFEQVAPIDPSKLREAAFERGFVKGEEEREKVMEEVGQKYGLEPEEVDEYLWADREKNEVMTSTTAMDITPEELVKRYNLSLTQTLLFDALELDIAISDNFKEIFSMIKCLGLMYSVHEEGDGEKKINVTGPASLFKKTRKYGTTMAKLLSSVMKAADWEIEAQVETEVGGEKRIYQFDLDSCREGLFPEMHAEESYDSEIERSFAERISSKAEGWEVSREPTFLEAGNSVMIPDFGFERRGEELHLEIVGFWTPEYLREKLDKVKKLDAEKDLLFAVDEELNCTEEDFGEGREVFFYGRDVPVHPVLERLREKEEKLVEDDLQRLYDGKIDLQADSDSVADLHDLSSCHGVEKKALEEYFQEEYPGSISNGKYVPPSVLDELKERIASLGTKKVSSVNEVLKEYGVAQNILEDLGYTITYTTLKQDELKIRKKDEDDQRDG